MLNLIIPFYNKNRLLVNSALSVVQVLAIGLTYFLLYTIVLRNLGPVKLGTWSLILSTSSVGNIANLSISTSLVKYIASYSKVDDDDQINNLVKTGLISIGMLMGVVVVIIYIIGLYILPSLLPESERAEGMKLLPLSLLSLFINSLNGIFLSTIDGLHHSSLRSVIYVISSASFLLFGYFLLLDFGIWGVAIAQVIQAVIVLVLAIIVIKVIFQKFQLFPIRWSTKTFRLIFNYSLNFQIIGIAQLLYDPTTKFLLSKYGNLSFVGFYEIASRVVVQLKSLIVSANQIIVPQISSNLKVNPTEHDPLYLKVFNLVYALSLPIGVLLFLFTDTISYYWFGYYEKYFIFTFIFLTIGNFFNLLSVPAYFSNMGIGELRGNLLSQLSIAFFNIALGFILGYLYGGYGVVIAWTISLIIGGIITITYYHYQFRIKYAELFTQPNVRMIFLSIGCVLLYLLLKKSIYQHLTEIHRLIINGCIFSAYTFSLYKFNPTYRIIRNKLLPNSVSST